MSNANSAYDVYQERLSDEMGIRQVGSPPMNVPSLLHDLGVAKNSFTAKKKAVAAWLDKNTPTNALREDLEDEGFI